jgi:hypothetical protein
MPKRARSETIVDFMEPPVRIQRVATTPDSGGADTETTPLHRANAIYQPRSQGEDTDGTQEGSAMSELPAVTLLLSLSGGGTSYEGTPSTIVGTQNDHSPLGSQLTGDSIE